MSTPAEPPVDTTTTTAETTDAPAETPAGEPAAPVDGDAGADADASAKWVSLVDGTSNNEDDEASKAAADETTAATGTGAEESKPEPVDAGAGAEPKEEEPKTEDAEAETPADETPAAGEAPTDADPKAVEEEPTKDVVVAKEGQGEDETKPSFTAKLLSFYQTNEFLILILLAILLAKAYPPLGAKFLAPKITATWIAVMFIFLLAGLGLKTEEFAKAFQRIFFNSFVQVFNFGVDSAIVFGFSRLLLRYNIIIEGLADGMVIASCLPMTINMAIVLTVASGGDEGSSIINSAFGNLVGVILSPILIMGYIGAKGNVKFLTVFTKLAIRVLLPIFIGQVLKWKVKPVADFVKRYKKYFKQLQMYSLVYIVYTVFCKTFSSADKNIPVGDIFLMIVFVFIMMTFLMILAWYSLRFFFANEPRLRAFGIFGCSHKTVAMGIPLINAIYEGNDNIAMYTLPLLIWHPMQLILGTFLAPRLLMWVEANVDDEEESKEGEEGEGKVVEEVKVIEVGEKGADAKEVDEEQGSTGDAKESEEENAAAAAAATAPASAAVTVEKASPDGDDVVEDEAKSDAASIGPAVSIEVDV